MRREAEPGLPSPSDNSLGDYLPFFLRMAETRNTSVRDLLLAQRGIALLPDGVGSSPDDAVRAIELELAGIGYVVSARLRDQLSRSSLDQLAEFLSWSSAALLAHIGGHVKHEPLFRLFPDGIPDNTDELWWKKVLVYFLQADDQPCLFCRRSGTTHVLNPCRHVVCDRCFDGSNYSGCPACEQKVERSSPFFQPSVERGRPNERVVFKLIDLAENRDDEVRQYFVGLCQRSQALSPDDRQALIVVTRELKAEVLPWLPDKIPVRENIAVVFGTLFKELDPNTVLPLAQRYMTTATDVLRLIAVMSGTDGSLLPETVIKPVHREAPSRQFWQFIAKLIGARPPDSMPSIVHVPVRVRRFKVARLPRSVRRALLATLEGLDAERLVEDMLRHRSYWVWVGEFLHPHEYATRFPNVSRAFQVVRKKAEDGTPAPKFRSWHSRLEQSLGERNLSQFLSILSERPGEFARRLDLALRIAVGNPTKLDSVIETFATHVADLATPVLLTLSSILPNRVERAKIRVYWPKGRIALGVSTADERDPLPEQAVSELVPMIHAELLRRFSEKPPFRDALIDERLQTVTVPFNERTASSSAITLPRGSRFSIEMKKTVRLFLHWCEPPGGGTTDLDLSVALYDSAWRFLGVCSYYELKLVTPKREIVAQSAGDLRNAPWPDGATEFVDMDCELAGSLGARFAVMVINAYAGLPFSQLERGFAGLMLRDDPAGEHFDPRTVKLKFALDGANGVFMPFVLDLQDGVLHWLDVQAKGHLEMNNVESSKSAIAKICPDLIDYFGSGVRPSMYDLALLHAAARCQRVAVRGDSVKQYFRRHDESALQFFSRLASVAPPDQVLPAAYYEEPVFAALYQGDIELPNGSSSYALFQEQITPTNAASDLLS
jgi:hypothetical protein